MCRFPGLGCQVVDVVIEKENGGEGRPSGEAYVRLAGRDDAERALQLNRKHMGHRYYPICPFPGLVRIGPLVGPRSVTIGHFDGHSVRCSVDRSVLVG